MYFNWEEYWWVRMGWYEEKNVVRLQNNGRGRNLFDYLANPLEGLGSNFISPIFVLLFREIAHKSLFLLTLGYLKKKKTTLV